MDSYRFHPFHFINVLFHFFYRVHIGPRLVSPIGFRLQTSSNNFEDAVRMLLVTLHTCQLPPQAYDAAQTIMSLLPTPEPSVDAVDIALDIGPSADVSPPAGDSDVTMSWTKRQLEGIEDSDEALLTWAKRIKAANVRQKPY